ncbi:uncharacterized protein At4g26450 isoform X1 [Coffea eugenioides]|uniref:Uncharacterized protein At4g26450 n=1 Tax=Coffea arabica TaxID=13443 RepID=A0A6P6XNM6_COFAR|nr:uncharacterized protein At4g26450 [Coffea arabica]XP_027127703.1 uncharacterized protein At4g26450 [Coffea arabica]XP_027170812.1 uncharacterized protein At4g26450 isoform X1 [Coffea eugenioides]
MHARNRSPGNGYRANAVVMGGVATTSRISPESSMRGHGGYNSEYRGYIRGGFGRGQSRQSHRSQPPPPPPPPQKGGGDIFMEAGRLAAEYLVSKGLLPAHVLSGKSQNGSLKNQVWAQEGDAEQLSLEGRTSALSRLGGPGPDSGPGRRRYMEEYNSKNILRGRRRNGSFKNYGSDWSRDVGRSGSWSERSRASVDGEDDCDVLSRHREEQQISNDDDSVSQNSIPVLAPENDVAGAKESNSVGNTQSASEKYEPRDDAKASAVTSTKDLPLKTSEEPIEKDDTKVSNAEAEDVKDDQMGLQNAKDDMAIVASLGEGAPSSEKNGDLLKLSHFAKVPTRPRSSMVVRVAKVDPGPMIVDESPNEGKPFKKDTDDLNVDDLSEDGSSNHTYDSNALNLDNLTVPAPGDKLGTSYSPVQGGCTASVSYLDRPSIKEHEEPDFGGINRVMMERGEKRALDDSNSSMGSKKPRELASFEDAESDGGISTLDPLDNQQTSEEPTTSEGQAVTLPSDDKRLLGISLYPKGDIGPSMDYAEEKQLFPGSFKTCDLNLMEASDANENHDNNPVLIFPSDTEKGKQAIPVDIDLSMSNNPRGSNRYGKCIVDGKDIEVIDLENDSAQEDKDSNNSERRTENVYSGLAGFSNNSVNANDIPDVQDGYGLMISELLGNDIPNCSSVPADMNSLHNEMGLHNGEGILGDDDSIYMSLGEIPISFLRVWEQPSQEYGKPF